MIIEKALHPQYLKTANGESPFVVLPIKEYNELIEDYNDLIVIEDRRNEKKISLKTLKENLSVSDNV